MRTSSGRVSLKLQLFFLFFSHRYEHCICLVTMNMNIILLCLQNVCQQEVRFSGLVHEIFLNDNTVYYRDDYNYGIGEEIVSVIFAKYSLIQIHHCGSD
jgi:hypothetical protein